MDRGCKGTYIRYIMGRYLVVQNLFDTDLSMILFHEEANQISKTIFKQSFDLHYSGAPCTTCMPKTSSKEEKKKNRFRETTDN